MVPGKREPPLRRGLLLTRTTCNGVRVADVVSAGGWEIDDHTREGILDPTKAPSFDKVNHYDYFVLPYGVPLRSLYATAPGNLFLAGRVMSASRLAFNSLRVMLTLAQLGQAAGTAAAFCARRRTVPARLTLRQIGRIQQELLRADVHVPGVRNQDPGDLARKTTVTASSSAPFSSTPGSAGLALNESLAQLLPVGDEGVTSVSAFVVAAAPAELRGMLVPAASAWDLDPLAAPPAAAVPLRASCSAGAQWVSFAVAARAVHRGYAWLLLEPAAGVTWCYSAALIPGCTAARLHAGRWWFAPGPFGEWHTFAVRLEPDPPSHSAPGAVRTARMTRWGACSDG